VSGLLSTAAIAVEALTVRYRRAVGCEGVSLRVPRGVIYALLGREGAGKSSVIRAVRGEEKPAGGRVLVCGLDSKKDRRRVRRLLEGDAPPAIVLDDPDLSTPDARESLDRAARRGVAILLASADAAAIEPIAGRVGVLRSGRMVLDEDASALRERFRRIRYRNERTPTREDYGTELDAFDAVRVRVRGWGIEAVVSNFSEDRLGALRSMDGVLDVTSEPLSLGEIFDAVSSTAGRA
jgi:ABC-type multidrug transport system ATPase subunit